MTSKEQNAQMRATIESKVVGAKILEFRIEGRCITIRVEGGYTCYFVAEDFELRGPGRWVFVPQSDLRAEKKAPLQSPANHGEQPKGTQGEKENA